MEVLIPIALITLVVIGLYFLIQYGNKLTKKLQALWLRLAREMDWEVLPIPTNVPWWQAKPLFQNLTARSRGLHARHEVRGSGKSKVAYFVLNIDLYGRNNWNLRLSREHLFTSIGKAFGMQDVIINDEEFDKFFLVKSDNENLAKMALSDRNTRKLLIQFWDGNALLKVENGRLHYEQHFQTFQEASFETWKKKLHFLISLSENWKDI